MLRWNYFREFQTRAAAVGRPDSDSDLLES